MSRKWFSIAALIAVATIFLSLSSCGFNQHLVSIQVVPSTVTFGGVGAALQFTANGTYDHPPETKDITNSVTWAIDSQYLATFSTTTPGLLTAINDCGTGNVTASFYDSPNNVVGYAFVSAAGVGTSACTSAALTVVVSGSGTVTSSPTGITCPTTCSAGFPLDSTVGLSATPGTGASTVTWTWPVGTAGCNTVETTSCTVILDTNQTITATFQ
jgi:hypothetical protein